MKTPIVAATFAALLVLAGCGSDDPVVTPAESTPPPEATSAPAPTVEETEAPEATEDDEPSEAPETTTEEPEQDAVDNDEEEDRFGPVVTSERGNLVKELGQLAGIANEDGEMLVEFALSEIVGDFECTSEWADEPQNGTYLGLKFDVTTTPLLAEDDWLDSFTITPHDFRLLSSDGVRENDSTGNAYSCLDSRDELPYGIGPSERASGWVVLDTALDSGVIIMENWSGGSWEWTF